MSQVEKIFTALRPRVSEEQPEPMNLAIAVEQELWNQLGSSNQDYAAQLRSVTFNLKDRSNIEFRAKVPRQDFVVLTLVAFEISKAMCLHRF